jgi:hypothetical protein
VREADLDATQLRRHAGAVNWQVGEVVGDDGRRSHGGLEHADEGVAVEGLNDLLLRSARARGNGQWVGAASAGSRATTHRRARYAVAVLTMFSHITSYALPRAPLDIVEGPGARRTHQRAPCRNETSVVAIRNSREQQEEAPIDHKRPQSTAVPSCGRQSSSQQATPRAPRRASALRERQRARNRHHRRLAAYLGCLSIATYAARGREASGLTELSLAHLGANHGCCWDTGAVLRIKRLSARLVRDIVMLRSHSAGCGRRASSRGVAALSRFCGIQLEIGGSRRSPCGHGLATFEVRRSRGRAQTQRGLSKARRCPM